MLLRWPEMSEDGSEQPNEGPDLVAAFDWRSLRTWWVSGGFAIVLGVASGAICLASIGLVEGAFEIQSEPGLVAVLLAAALHHFALTALSKMVLARRNGGHYHDPNEIMKYRISHDPRHLWHWWRWCWFSLVLSSSYGFVTALPVECERTCVVTVICLGLATAIIGKEFPIRVLWTPANGNNGGAP